MKKTMLTFLVTLSLIRQAECAYPTVQEAELLFASNRLNNAESRVSEKMYEDFFEHTHDFSPGKNSREIERIVFDGLTSINIIVSTNEVNDDVGIDLLRTRWIREIGRSFFLVDFVTNAPACLTLAKYIGDLKAVEYPTDCLRRSAALIIMKSLNDQRKTEEEIRQIVVEADEFNRSMPQKQKREVYRLQQRVSSANSAIERFRRDLLSLCARSVEGCKSFMSEQEFSIFTNRVVELSRPTQAECNILFKRIHRVRHSFR